MFFRVRVALGIASLITLITSIAAFAKGGFSFISITGGNLKEELRVTDPDLTTDFFAFADFSTDRTKAPADPGTGYEITRYYIDGKRETAFDRLHYYPETGFVYYNGIVNGSSEYDGEWYTAKPEIRKTFESVLPGRVKSVEPVAQQPVPASQQQQSNASNLPTQTILLIVITTALAVILLLASWFRQPAAR
ncbi:MAG TPA: hypothetical protein VFQ13_19700 [Anaerolineales bacterium]|nr:hypothetical protein [Anaerolineales bacterium]